MIPEQNMQDNNNQQQIQTPPSNQKQETQKNYNNKIINIDTSNAKIVAEIICKEIETSFEGNKKIYDRADRSERQYQQISKYAANNKLPNDPWLGSADYFVPLTEWIIDAVWGRVCKSIFGKRPYMQAKGVEASDVGKQEGVTDFVDQIHCEVINFNDVFKYYVKQMIKLPMAVLKYCWKYENEKTYENQEVIVFISQDGISQEKVFPDEQEKIMQLMQAGFQPVGKEESVVLNDKTIYNNSKLEYIKLSDYVWASNTKKGMKPYWEGDRFWQTINEIENNEFYIKDSVEKLKKTIELNGLSMSQQVLAQRGKLFECFHWYGRLPIDKNLQVNFSDKEALEHEVHAVVSYGDKELLYLSRWEYARSNVADRVYIRAGFEETDDFSYRSLCDKLYMTQKELNTLHNNIMNNAQLAMMKVLWKRRSLQGEEWEKPTFRPGLILDVDMPGDVGVLELGDIKNIGFELEQSFINFAERISNISVYQTGTARQGGGNKTKGEVDATIYEGNIGMDKFIENCFLVMKKVCQWTVDYYYHNMPEGLERRIRGENEQTIFPTQKNMQMFNEKNVLPYWESDDLAGQFDFIWEGTSLNSSEAYNINLSNDLLRNYMSQPMISQNLLAVWEILRMGLEARKVKNWQNILPQREAIIAEMERMKAEAEAKAMNQNRENLKQNVINKASQKGVPAREAMMMAENMMNQQQTGA